MVPVFRIKTKQAEKEAQRSRLALLKSILELSINDKEILVVKNGMVCPPSEYHLLQSFSSDMLSNVSVMAIEDAKAFFGSIAKPINLVITTYRP